MKWREYIKGRIWTNEVHFIQKMWTFGMGTKVNFFLVYLTKEDFDKGINIANVPNLRDAKKYCETLTNPSK